MVAETIQKVIPSKKTRLNTLKVICSIGTVAYVMSFLGYAHPGQEVSFAAWAGLMTGMFTAYGATEVGDKYSHAVMNK